MIITFPANKYKVEPGNIHHITNITSINIANVERTLADPPLLCTPEDIPDTYVTEKGPAIGTYKGKNIYAYARDIHGAINIVPGFNCGILKTKNNNELQISGNKGYSKSISEKQEEYEIYEGELLNKPENAVSLSGGIPCSVTVKAINGYNAKNIIFNAGPGISITTDGNTIKLDVVDPMLKGNCKGACFNSGSSAD